MIPYPPTGYLLPGVTLCRMPRLIYLLYSPVTGSSPFYPRRHHALRTLRRTCHSCAWCGTSLCLALLLPALRAISYAVLILSPRLWICIQFISSSSSYACRAVALGDGDGAARHRAHAMRVAYGITGGVNRVTTRLA